MSRPNSGTKTHRRHHSGSNSKSDDSSGHSYDSDQYRRHHRSKSGNVERHRTDSNGSQLSNKLEYRSNNDYHPPIRPTSLIPLKTEGEPEQEPLRFDVALVGAPPEVEQLVNNIKQVAESFLYHWKTFPIVLPSPVSQCDSFPNQQVSIGGSLSRTKTRYHLRDLFVAPSFDELDAVAVDSKGEPRRLTGKQLEYIRERGEFQVESLNFPGQQHCWKLSQLLQKGTENSRLSLLNDLALALRFLFITAKGRLFSHFFSVRKSLNALYSGFLRIFDILIGTPSLQAHNLDAKIREERTKYLVAELVCRPENEENLQHLCSYIRKQLRRSVTEKFDVEKECSQIPVGIPYKFLTPSGIELDLRLWDRCLMRKTIPILVNILERETRGWFLHFRERLIAELRAQKMPDEDIEKEVNNAVMREYLQRVYSSILSHSEIQNLGDGIAQLLVQQAQSVVLMHKAMENVQFRLLKTQEEYKTRLCNNYPVLSRIEPWLRHNLRKAEEKFNVENQWSAYEEALGLCNNNKLSQTVYFLNRDLAFMKEREPALLRELGKVKIPTRSFLWPTQIWMPTNWIIKRNFQGQSEIVPTILSKQVTSITTPRSDPSQPVFLVEKETIRTTTTRWPFWRLFNYFHRTWCWSWNAMFFFGIVLPWCSPIGLRALFCMEPFMADLELSQINGTLFPRKSSKTQTLCSRLLRLWRHISKSRTHFETKPDTGFIGKGFTRHLNRFWNYFIKGLFGTMFFLFIYPLVCLFIIFTSVFIAFTAVCWMPLLTFIVQIMNAFIYDLDCPELKRNRFFIIFETVLWRILFQGLIQPICAVFVAGIVCPVVSLCILIGGLARYWLRLCWDTTLFHLIIKKRGRIPASDSFVVRRISGPGLATDYYFQISPEQALAAFESKMELDELAAYQNVMENVILQPQRDFSQFVEACFGSFSTQLAKNGPYKILEKQGQDLIGLLHEKLEKRRRDLQTGLSVSVKSKIKLEMAELKIAIQQGALMLERFYPSHILPKLGCTEDQFWDNRALCPGDWAGLAGQLYTEIFSLDILTPLDHTDTSFRLDPHPQVDLTRYTEMVHSAQLGGTNGPDLLGNVYTPRGNIQVHSPYLEVSAFNPRTLKQFCANINNNNNSNTITSGKNGDKRCEFNTILGTLRNGQSASLIRMPWKKPKVYVPEKMIIPLPVPHPAHIAVTIYNRDSDDPIPLESDLCQCILRAIEESQISLDDAGISRYKGGGIDNSYETTTSSSNDTLNRQNSSSTDGVYQWTLNNWTGQRKRNYNTGKVDLASPEDVTLDSDSTRVVFSTYGTTV